MSGEPKIVKMKVELSYRDALDGVSIVTVNCIRSKLTYLI